MSLKGPGLSEKRRKSPARPAGGAGLCLEVPAGWAALERACVLQWLLTPEMTGAFR